MQPVRRFPQGAFIVVRRLFMIFAVLVGTALYTNALLPRIVMPTPFSVSAALTSGADNRYCAAPRTPQFGGAKDGPAALPTKCINNARSSTPRAVSTWSVCGSGCAFTTLQAAVNAAACGDTVELAAGETFSSGKITFPAKGCDDAHWITVRTSTPDNLLPPEGTRMTPCWAGVASLPGRPPYDCPSGGPASPSRLARIVIAPSNGSIFIPGDHYRLIGLEVTRP